MWLGLGVVALVAIMMVVVGWMGLTGSLPRNHVAGIRTRFTLSSDDAWQATHRAAAPYLIFGGVAAAMAAVAFLPFAAAGKLPPAVAGVATVVAAAVVGVSAMLGWRNGTRAARRELGKP